MVSTKFKVYATVPKPIARSVEVWLPSEGPPDVFEAYPVGVEVWQDTQGRLFVGIDGDKDPTPYEYNEWRMVCFIDQDTKTRFEIWNVRYSAYEKRMKIIKSRGEEK